MAKRKCPFSVIAINAYRLAFGMTHIIIIVTIVVVAGVVVMPALEMKVQWQRSYAPTP